MPRVSNDGLWHTPPLLRPVAAAGSSSSVLQGARPALPRKPGFQPVMCWIDMYQAS